MTHPFEPANPEPDPFRPRFAPPPAPSTTWAPPNALPATDSPVVTARSTERPRGRGIGALVAAAALSAVLATGGTAAVVTQLLPGAPAAASGAGAGTARTTSTGSTTVSAEDLTAMVASAKESVVTITADGMSTDRFSPFGQPTRGIGSGIILTADGYILTNRHVTENSTSLSVELHDGSTYPATLVEQAT
ncbi:MAG TPA: trypsin-like peptidase domain-containing protein, partial [Candidatus Limnocylindrales bacterium]